MPRKGLVKKKLAVREYDLKDRRTVLVSINETGKAKSNIYQKKLMVFFKKIACGLRSEERRSFIELSKSLNYKYYIKTIKIAGINMKDGE